MSFKLELDIPEELRQDLSRYFPDVGWHKLAKVILLSELKKLVRLKREVEQLGLSESDVKRMSDDVNASLAKRFRAAAEAK